MGAWIESTDIFSDVFIRPLHGTLGFIKATSQSMSSLLSTLSVLLFWQFSIIRVLVLYFHYGYSISTEKLTGHQAFESLGLSGALTFLFKQHIS